MSEPAPISGLLQHERWQKRLLPFIVVGIFLLGLMFFAISIWQLTVLQARFKETPEGLIAPVSSIALNSDQLKADNMQPALIMLEHNLVVRRYHQANTLLLARVWIGYVMIATGMILCLIGSLFVLGKLSSSETKVSGSTGGGSVSFVSTSPGLVLAFFGVALAISAQFLATRLIVTDTATYFKVTGVGARGNGAAASAPPISE